MSGSGAGEGRPASGNAEGDAVGEAAAVEGAGQAVPMFDESQDDRSASGTPESDSAAPEPRDEMRGASAATNAATSAAAAAVGVRGRAAPLGTGPVVEMDQRGNIAAALAAEVEYRRESSLFKCAPVLPDYREAGSRSAANLFGHDRRPCAQSPGGRGNVLVYETPSMASQNFQSLNEMRQRQLLCNVMLCVDGTDIPAHRSVLASVSPYFYAMFISEMAEASLKDVPIHGVDPKAMALLVQYAYTSVIEVQEDNVQQLLPAARLLQLESVVSACCHFLEAELHPSNCLGVRQFADLHACTELYAAADAFAKRRFTEVCRHEEFLELPIKDVVELMSADDLGVKSEEQVFEAALTWLHYCGDGDESDLGSERSSRQPYIGKVMSAVRLPMCTKHFLVRCADRDEILHASNDYKDLMIEALKYQLISPNERQEMAVSMPGNWRIRDRHRGSLPHALMVIGGQAPKAVRSVEKCDLGTVQWSYSSELNSRRCRCGVAVMHDNVFAIGGFDGSSRVRSVETYNVQHDTWQIVASMNVRRSTLGAAMLGGLVYAVGGFDGSVGLDTVERYNAAKNEWTLVSAMSVRRSSVGVAAMGGYLYALGGYDGATRHCLASVECYDKDADRWRPVADMNQTRSGAAVAVVGDQLYAIGGHDGPEIRRSVEMYDPVTDKWTLCASMICARRNAGAVAVDGMVYVVGGDDGSSNLSSVEMFDPQANAWYMLNGLLQVGRSYAAVTAIERPVEDATDGRKRVGGSEDEIIWWK